MFRPKIVGEYERRVNQYPWDIPSVQVGQSASAGHVNAWSKNWTKIDPHKY